MGETATIEAADETATTDGIILGKAKNLKNRLNPDVEGHQHEQRIPL